jgi:hypothetical protein
MMLWRHGAVRHVSCHCCLPSVCLCSTNTRRNPPRRSPPEPSRRLGRVGARLGKIDQIDGRNGRRQGPKICDAKRPRPKNQLAVCSRRQPLARRVRGLLKERQRLRPGRNAPLVDHPVLRSPLATRNRNCVTPHHKLAMRTGQPRATASSPLCSRSQRFCTGNSNLTAPVKKDEEVVHPRPQRR